MAHLQAAGVKRMGKTDCCIPGMQEIFNAQLALLLLAAVQLTALLLDILLIGKPRESLTRVTKSYLLALGTTRIGNYY